MRTLKQIKDDVALANDYKHWDDVIDDHMELEFIDQCMKEAQKEAIKNYHKEVQSLNYCTSFNPLIREELLKIENQ